ncbi:MAG: hypothetical protein ABWZ77_03145, partial [Naasia sp.]
MPARPPVASSNLPFHDDDELANALAAQLLRFAPSGPIPIIRPEDAAPAVVPGSSPSVDSAPTPEPVPAPESEPKPEAEPEQPAPVPEQQPEPAPEQPEPIPEQQPEPEPAPELEPEQQPESAREQAPEPQPAPERELAQQSAPELELEPVPASDQESEDGARGDSEPPPVTAPIGTVPTPPAVAAGDGGSALAQAERLQPALDALSIDDETLQEWERSLLALAPDAPPPAEESDTPDVPGTPASDDESASSSRPSSPDPTAAASDTVTDADTDADDAIGPRRGTFDPLPSTTAALVPVGAPSTSGDDDRSDTDSAPEASSSDEPEPAETTSTITVGAPSPEASLPQDELIATIVPPGSAPTGELDVVEAEVLDQDGEGHVETVGTDDVDRGEADDDDDDDGSAADIGSASVPVITGLVPTPTRWSVEGEDAAAPMRRPSSPGVPVASTQDDAADPASEGDTSDGGSSEGPRSEDQAASSASDDAGPTPVAPQVQAGSL